MRKTGRIVTLVLAVVSLIPSVLSLYNHTLQVIFNTISYFTYFYPSDANRIFFYSIYAFTASFSLFFALIYIIFSLKNGLGAELYAWSKEKHMQYLEERKEKKLLKQQKKKEKLQKKLEKLNTESDE